jgi:hypothetical protein
MKKEEKEERKTRRRKERDERELNGAENKWTSEGLGNEVLRVRRVFREKALSAKLQLKRVADCKLRPLWLVERELVESE